jgi:DNA (cytosine-5)-methyltransferase 1
MIQQSYNQNKTSGELRSGFQSKSKMKNATTIRLLNGSADIRCLGRSAFVPQEDGIPIISMFTGGGFLDLGLMRAGFSIKWSLEVQEKFCDAHDFGMESLFRAWRNSGSVPTIACREDIRSKAPGAIRREALGVVSKGDHFGIVGGPPCPDFSVGGKNRGFAGNKGQLTQVFIERICELEPSFFLIDVSAHLKT